MSRTRLTRKVTLMVAMAAVLVLGSSCAWNDERNEKRGRGDSGVASIDDTPKEVIHFPDRFSNVAHACDGHGHRVFVTTKSDSSRALFVWDDPTCQEAAK